jgi:ribosomal protein S27E
VLSCFQVLRGYAVCSGVDKLLQMKLHFIRLKCKDCLKSQETVDF